MLVEITKKQHTDTYIGVFLMNKEKPVFEQDRQTSFLPKLRATINTNNNEPETQHTPAPPMVITDAVLQQLATQIHAIWSRQ